MDRRAGGRLGILVRAARSPWCSGAGDVDIARARAILALA
jgi:hypothetical protein